jgi:mannose-6-phosphate isomerase-like protein (cupin superfamily)
MTMSENGTPGPSQAPFVIGSEEGKSLMPSVILKISSQESAGAFEVMDLQGPLAPSPHVHAGREELFYIIEGRFEFRLGHDIINAEPGSFVFVPRGTRHAPKAGPGTRAIVFVAPAGLEGFFEELGEGLAAGKSQDEIRETLRTKYDSVPAS